MLVNPRRRLSARLRWMTTCHAGVIRLSRSDGNVPPLVGAGLSERGQREFGRAGRRRSHLLGGTGVVNQTLRRRFRERWDRLTDDDLERVDGRAERLIDLLQQRYGYQRHRAARDLLELLDASMHRAAGRVGPAPAQERRGPAVGQARA
jgi:hypothetical protein